MSPSILTPSIQQRCPPWAPPTREDCPGTRYWTSSAKSANVPPLWAWMWSNCARWSAKHVPIFWPPSWPIKCWAIASLDISATPNSNHDGLFKHYEDADNDTRKVLSLVAHDRLSSAQHWPGELRQQYACSCCKDSLNEQAPSNKGDQRTIQSASNI